MGLIVAGGEMSKIAERYFDWEDRNGIKIILFLVFLVLADAGVACVYLFFIR